MPTPDDQEQLEALAAGIGRAFGAVLAEAADETGLALSAHAALDACLDGDDDSAHQALAELNPKQLQDVEKAAVAVSLLASRLRGADSG